MPEKRKTDNISIRIWLETIQSIVGENGLKSILNYAHLKKYIDNFPPDDDNLEIPLGDLQNLYLSLLELFGRKGTTGLQLRVGRENIRAAIEKRPKIAKALQLSARLLPETKRMRVALEKFAEEAAARIPSQYTPRIEVREVEDYFIVVDKDWHESEGIVSTVPGCGVYVGMLQYSMEWITGHLHEVEEIECRAMGHPADVFRIAKARKEE